MQVELLDSVEVPYFEGYRCIGLYKYVELNSEYDYHALDGIYHVLEYRTFVEHICKTTAFTPIYVKAQYGQPVVNRHGVPVVIEPIDELVNAAVKEHSDDYLLDLSGRDLVNLYTSDNNAEDNDNG